MAGRITQSQQHAVDDKSKISLDRPMYVKGCFLLGLPSLFAG